MKTKTRIFLLVISLVVIFGVVVAGYIFLKPAPLIVQGEVEATQIRIASKLVGRVKMLNVREGESVKKGQQLFTIDSPEIDAKLRQASAAKKAAYAEKQKADKGLRKEQINSAYSVFRQAKAGHELANKSYNRILRLFKDGIVPQQKLDEAEAQLKVANEKEETALETYKMAKSGAREEDKAAAAALLDRAEGSVAEVNTYIQETRLTAPIDSEVVDVYAETGELISAGYPVVSLIDLNDIWITFNLREDLLSKIKIGTIITADIPAINRKGVKLKVNYIKDLGLYAVWSATKTSGDFDMKTFEVRAIPVGKINGLRPGMSALVKWNKSEIRSYN